MTLSRLKVATDIQTWPLKENFTISRGSKHAAIVVVARLTDGTHVGTGECVPYPRYGETPDDVCTAIEALFAAHPDLTRGILQKHMPPGAARNALDCAFWALEAKRKQTTVSKTLDLNWPNQITTCQTISLTTPDEMAAAALRMAAFPLLKLKLGADGDAERMAAVRSARPDARLVGDANEGWTPEALPKYLKAAAANGFELIEQPLPAAADDLLAAIPHPVPVCADESAHTAEGLTTLARRYDAVNVKLDKTGGLTGAITMVKSARELGLKIMIGCMVSTSLSMAPALHLAPYADWIDLDGPLLLATDRSPGLRYDNAAITTPEPEIWA